MRDVAELGWNGGGRVGAGMSTKNKRSETDKARKGSSRGCWDG
jgi:hypothetical protein